MATVTRLDVFIRRSVAPEAHRRNVIGIEPCDGRNNQAPSRWATAMTPARAIAGARAAADGWARLTAFERAAKMHTVGDIIETRRDELARILTWTRAEALQAEAYGEVDELVEYWRMAAEDAKRLGGELPNSFSPGKRVMLARRARGVVGVISPWNWPCTMPARARRRPLGLRQRGGVDAGAVHLPGCAVELARCIADADLPPGVFNLVTGPGPVVGDEIARNPGVDGVAFIGSTATGRLVAGAAAGKATLLEMGGNGPLVVLDDGDVDAAVQATLLACFLCAGQKAAPPASASSCIARCTTSTWRARTRGHRADRARRPVRRRDHHGPAQQRAGGGEDGRARGRRAAARRRSGHRRLARNRLPHRPLLGAHRARRRPRRRRRGHRGDLSARWPPSWRSPRSRTRSG